MPFSTSAISNLSLTSSPDSALYHLELVQRRSRVTGGGIRSRAVPAAEHTAGLQSSARVRPGVVAMRLRPWCLLRFPIASAHPPGTPCSDDAHLVAHVGVAHPPQRPGGCQLQHILQTVVDGTTVIY